MDITSKIDMIIEATVPSQGNILSAIGKGLEDSKDITSKVGMSLWHYFDLKIIKGNIYPKSSGSSVTNAGYIFKSQSSNKLADELWYRIGKSVEDSERLTDEGLKKLKNSFYSIVNKWGKVYTFDQKNKRWEFIG